jgi:UbiA prenyltransferase family
MRAQVGRAAAHALSLVRFGNWWAQKLPPLLFVAYVELIRRQASPRASLATIGVLLLCVSCVAAYGHVVNDWCDIADDERAGKPNAMRDLRPAQRAALCLGCVVVSFTALVPWPVWPVWAILALNYAWPTLYSVPPVRLKERGLLGVLTDAAGSHITPTAFAFALAGAIAGGPGDPLLLAAVLCWATALGLKGILYHQIADKANDERAGVVTFATARDASALSAALARYNLWVEVPISLCVVALIATLVPLAVVALVLYVALEFTKYRLGFEFAVSADARLRRPSVPFANEMFYTLWMPLAACVQLAVRDAWLAWLPLAHCVLFGQQVIVQFRDASAVAGQFRLRFHHLRSKGARR